MIRNPRVPTCTFALSHAMSADDSSDAVLFCFTSPTPRTISALCITSSTASVPTEVSAVCLVDFISSFSATPLRLVHCGSNALHCVVLGGHRAYPTTITFPTLLEHVVRFNELRVSQLKTVLFKGSKSHRQSAQPTVSAAIDMSPFLTVSVALACVPTERISTTVSLVPKSVPLGETLATEYRTTVVLKTKLGADPQPGWVAFPHPEEVVWTTIVKSKTSRKVSIRNPPALVTKLAARATTCCRSNTYQKIQPVNEHCGRGPVSSDSNSHSGHSPVDFSGLCWNGG